MIEKTETETISQIVESLRAALGERLVAVVLFGSRTRGDATPESDWDLQVIARELPESYWERHLFFVHALPVDLRSGTAIIARTPQEFEARIPALQLDISIDGKILYDPQHYATERLDYIRNLIKQTGLYRERSEAGDLWLWKKRPTGPWALEWGLFDQSAAQQPLNLAKETVRLAKEVI